MVWLVPLVGLVFLTAGLAAYAGFAKPRIVTMWPKPTLGFGTAWLGAAEILLFPVAVTNETWRIPSFIVGLFGTVCFFVALMSFFWLPRRLLPRWYVEWVDGGRSIEQVQRWPEFGRGGSA